jgi:hypothetical protein
LVGILRLHNGIILNLSSEVYGFVVTETVPTEPEADTEEGRAKSNITEETNVIEPITDGMAGRAKGETWGPSW